MRQPKAAATWPRRAQTAEALRESELRFRDFALTSSDWF
jgi:hypothetical protein